MSLKRRAKEERRLGKEFPKSVSFQPHLSIRSQFQVHLQKVIKVQKTKYFICKLENS